MAKISNKKVVKKDGKAIVTYNSTTKGIIGKYPTKVTKTYDSKGNLLGGKEKVIGSYGASTTRSIPAKKKTPVSKNSEKSKATFDMITKQSNVERMKNLSKGKSTQVTKTDVRKVLPKSSYLTKDAKTGKYSTPSVVSNGKMAKVDVKPKVTKKPTGSKAVSTSKPAVAKVEPKSMKVPGVTMSGASVNESIVLKPKALQMIETGSTTPSELIASKMPEATAEQKKGLIAKIKEKVNDRRLAKIEKLKGKVAENNVMKKGGIKK